MSTPAGTHTVAIVGAGLSGLSAASALCGCGLDVVVLDKGRGVGGRMTIRRHDPWVFDHGAQFFKARDPLFIDAVERWCRAGVAAEWSGRIVRLAHGALEACTDGPRYVGVPGMNAVARHLARDLDVRCGARVAGLAREGDHWALTNDEAECLARARAVIITAPAPQAVELLGDSARSLVESISACRLAPCWAVLIGLDTPLNVPFDAAFIADCPLSWIARNNAKPQRGSAECWTLHGSPAWSAAHLEATPADVAARLLDVLNEVIDGGVPQPRLVDTHRWRYALPIDPPNTGCLGDDAARIVVCGDWCHSPRVEGAYLSGVAAADRVLATL